MFLEKLKKEVDDNLTNDQFSVEELAKNIGMSRSQLHRKLNTATGQSVSQFIREYRLQRGMELLKEGDLNAAEVADRIGFGSATYFNKCFNEYYGYPPGEVKNKMAENAVSQNCLSLLKFSSNPSQKNTLYLKLVASGIILLIMGNFIFQQQETGSSGSLSAMTNPSPFFPLKTSARTQRTRIFQ